MSARNLAPPYPYPPITEAVVELRFDSPVSDAMLRKAAGKFSQHYPNEQMQVTKGIKVDLGAATAEFEDKGKTYKRSSDDEAEILLLGEQNFAVSQLAVYPGWDRFHERFVRDWSVFKRVAGFRKLVQIGMRFINRIDVPFDTEGLAHHERYLTLRIALPNEYPHTTGYSLYAQLPIEAAKCVANVNSGAVPSPLPEFGSFLLDIDLVRTVDVPQRDEDIGIVLALMREEKNRLFETLITDAARERFFDEQPLQ